MGGVAGHAKGLALNEAGTFVAASSFNRGAGLFIHGQDIVAVHSNTRHSVCLSSDGDILYRHLLLNGGGIGVLVIVTDEDNGDLLNRRQIKPLVPVSSAGCTISEVTKH